MKLPILSEGTSRYILTGVEPTKTAEPSILNSSFSQLDGLNSRLVSADPGPYSGPCGVWNVCHGPNGSYCCTWNAFSGYIRVPF